MATLIVRDLADELAGELKARARRHGRSAEAEHRAILEQVLRPRTPMREVVAAWLAGERAELDGRSLTDQGVRVPDLGS